MKKVIHKYSLNHTDAPEITTSSRNGPFRMKMKKGSEILSIQPQPEINTQKIQQITGKIWAMHDPLEKEMEDRTFMLIESDKEFEKTENTKFIGTFQLNHIGIVLHLFEIL